MEAQAADAKNQEQLAWFETILTKHVSDRTVSRVLSVDFISAVPEGNNYTSIILRGTLNVILHSGQKAKLTVIVKKALDVEEKAKVTEALAVFKTEVVVYKELLVKFEQLMNEYQDTNDKLWCNLLAYQPYKLLVFEDLKMQNFKMAERRGMLDKNYALLILNSLGRFHAIGYTLLKRGIMSKNDLPPYFMEIDSPHILNLFDGGLTQLCRVMENDWAEEWKEVAKKLIKQKEVMSEKLKKLCVKKDDTFVTLAHGDCWTCNMMFKYCPYDETLPIAVKFIDFQTPHIGSFAFDVVYFLYISVRPDIRRTYWEELINMYYNSLKATLKFYNMEDSTPTLEYVNAELKRLDYYAMVINLLFLPITCADVKDAFIMEKLETGCDNSEAFNPEIFKSQFYKDNVQVTIKKWLEDGLF